MIPVVNMDKGLFPDNAPYLTIRVPAPHVFENGTNVIIGYTWINLITGDSGYVGGNASHVFADGSPVILLKGEVPIHISGCGTVFGV